jgi:hypothetical protein
MDEAQGRVRKSEDARNITQRRLKGNPPLTLSEDSQAKPDRARHQTCLLEMHGYESAQFSTLN